MVQRQTIISVPVIWRGKKFVIEINSEASLKELGEELQTLTNVKADTIRLIIPQPSIKSSRLLMPFSDEHTSLRLQDAGIVEVYSIIVYTLKFSFSYPLVYKYILVLDR